MFAYINTVNAIIRYHLKDAIIGKIYFLLVRVKIKHMEIHVIKRETMGSGPNVFHDEDTIAKYEIMDGAPVKGNILVVNNSSIMAYKKMTKYPYRRVHPYQTIFSGLRVDTDDA